MQHLDSLVDLLRARARLQPHDIAYIYLVDGELQESPITYGELDLQARRVAALLREHGAQRAVLLYPPDLNYVIAFFGCLYANVVAVPAYPPDPGRLSRTLPRLQSIITDCSADVVLTTEEILGMAQFLFAQAPDLESKTWLATDRLPAGAESGWSPLAIGRSDVAFLQYTSGSTGTPKGVILSHGNLLHNLDLISEAFEIDDATTGVSWLPPYHDMGLIGGILAPMFKGVPTALMSPVAFLQRPLRWLKAISRFRATISGGPNFAYELCIRKVSAEEREALDLSRWSLAFTGAEPVRAETMRRFAETFAGSGFEPRAFYPCYGLAEATLIVSGGAKGADSVVRRVDAAALQHDRAVTAEHDADAQTLVGCGASLRDQQIVIVRPGSLTEASPGDVGEIWVRGPSVALGYWSRPEETAQTFGAHLADDGSGPYLRTGDLGFVSDGQLFITGRLKDLVIIRGRNHYPQDIEHTVEESHPSLRRGCCAAFAFEVGTEELLVVAIEVERRHHDRRRAAPSPASQDRRGPDRRSENVDHVDHVTQVTGAPAGAAAPAPFDPDAICDAIRAAVQKQHELRVYDVVLLQPGGLPKTSSGKIQRRECRAGYLDGTLEKMASSVLRTEPRRNTSVTHVVGPEVRALAPKERRAWIVDFLKQQIANTLSVPVQRIDSGALVSSLGLDSLMAMDLGHRVERSLRVVLPATAFLRDLTIEALGQQIDDLLLDPVRDEGVGVESRVDEVGLSEGQKALWYLHALAPESSAYNVSCAMRVTSPLDVEALRASFVRLIDRHPVLRTSYPVVEGRPVPRMGAASDFGFTHRTTAAADLDRLAAEAAEEPFDLAAGPVFRVVVLTRSGDDHVVVVTVHHIAADMWSLVLMLDELRASYASAHGIAPPREPDALQYRDFVMWQKEYLASTAGEMDRVYWLGELADVPTLDLPTDRPRPRVQTFRGGTHVFPLAPSLATAARGSSGMEGATLYVVLMATFSALLSRYSGQERFAVGSPVAARARAGFDAVVGYFVNPLVVLADLTDDPSFTTLVGRVRTTVLDGLEHQNYPFLKLVEQLGGERDPGRSPLFQAMFVLEKPHVHGAKELAHVALGVPGRSARLGPLSVESYPLPSRSAQFDLALVVVDAGDDIVCSLQYNADLFDVDTVERIGKHFETLLASALAEPNRPLSQIALVAPAERAALVEEATTPPIGAPVRCLHELIAAQAERTPDAIAVATAEGSLTYRALDQRATRVAARLRALGVGPEVFVAVCMERRPELVVALLGVLKAGGAYVPIDPRYPVERQALLLEDAGAPLIVTETKLRDGLPPGPARTALITELMAADPPVTAGHDATPDHAAYVIYTSGSTGRPKGVVIEHASASRLLSWAHVTYGDRLAGVLAATSVCFDLSVFELFAPLSYGGTIILATDALSLPTLAEAPRATLVNTVPSVMTELLRLRALPASAATVNLAGEALSPPLVDQLYALGTVERVYDLYGPSEDTTYSTCALRAAGAPATIGAPLPGSQAHVVDRFVEPVPAGVVGEIYLGGGGLGRGYHRRPALTAERFVPDPLGSSSGGRLYRTGDLARRPRPGQLQFLGRADHQVKLRGFRIELGEIEACLASRPGVSDVVVVVRGAQGADQRLVAYVAAEPSVTPAALRRATEQRMPQYMVPADFVVLPTLPRTPNGKIDRRALPGPVEATTDGHVAPRNALETVIAEIAAQVLSLPRVGVTESFFALGGHSLLATQLVARIRDLLGVEIPLSTLFEAPSVAALADAIGRRPDGDLALESAEILLEVSAMSDSEARATLEATTGRRAGTGSGR